jgi:hypothetical protein
MSLAFLKKKKVLALLIGGGLAMLGAAAVAGPLVLDWRVNGNGVVTGTCESMGALSSGCTSISTGPVLGTHIGSGTYTLTVTTGNDNGSNPMATNNATNSQGGKCLPADGSGTITAASGDVINFNSVGWVCEEGPPGSDYHYNATYRMTTGTGRFSDVVGGGNLAATFEKMGGTNNSAANNATYIKIDGTINF